MLPTRVHAIVLVSKLHKPTHAGAGLRQGDPAQRRSRRSYVAIDADATGPDPRGVGRARHRRPAQGAVLAVPRDHPADRRVRHGDPATPTRAASSRSTSRSTSSAAGGSSCCTTRPRCGSRAGCCSRPGVMVTSVPYQLRSSQLGRGARRARGRAGQGRRPARGRTSPARAVDEPVRDEPRTRAAPTSAADGRSRVGERFEVEVGPVAHGGHCVARLDEGPRSAWSSSGTRCPGERVVVEITEGTEGDRFLRGDAVEVLDAVGRPGRAALPVRRPGLCGGCDFQHVALPRAARAEGGGGARSSCAGSPGSTVRRWTVRAGARRRATGCAGAPGCGASPARRRPPRPAQHRSHDVVPVDDCLITRPDAP